jgi:hypothetical protein
MKSEMKTEKCGAFTFITRLALLFLFMEAISIALTLEEGQM